MRYSFFPSTEQIICTDQLDICDGHTHTNTRACSHTKNPYINISSKRSVSLSSLCMRSGWPSRIKTAEHIQQLSFSLCSSAWWIFELQLMHTQVLFHICLSGVCMCAFIFYIGCVIVSSSREQQRKRIDREKERERGSAWESEKGEKERKFFFSPQYCVSVVLLLSVFRSIPSSCVAARIMYTQIIESHFVIYTRSIKN